MHHVGLVILGDQLVGAARGALDERRLLLESEDLRRDEEALREPETRVGDRGLNAGQVE